jgi:hypothetical protein
MDETVTKLLAHAAIAGDPKQNGLSSRADLEHMIHDLADALSMTLRENAALRNRLNRQYRTLSPRLIPARIA